MMRLTGHVARMEGEKYTDSAKGRTVREMFLSRGWKILLKCVGFVVYSMTPSVFQATQSRTAG
jgi:hypothetical protein